MLLQYDQFFRRFVNRRDANLLAPRIFPNESLNLPKHSVIHYLPSHFSDVGPSQTDPIFKGVTRIIGTYYIEDLATKEGNPRVVNAVYKAEMRRYQTENKRIRRIFDLQLGLKDAESPLVMNYCYMERKIKYFTNPKSNWYKENNRIYTVIKGMEDVYKANPNSRQILFINNPNTLPPLAFFLAINNNETNANIAKFNSFEKVLVLHLTNLVLNQGIRNAFSELPKKALSQIDLVFLDSGYFSIINLGGLYSWVKSVDNPSGKNPRIMRTYIIKFLLSLMGVRSEDVDEIMQRGEDIDKGITKDNTPITEIDPTEQLEKETKIEKREKAILEENDDTEDEEDTVDDIKKHQVDVNTTLPNKSSKEIEEAIDVSIRFDEKKDQFVYDSNILTEKEQRELDLIEAQLQEELSIEKEVQQERTEEIIPGRNNTIYVEDYQTPEDAVRDQLDDLIENGSISPNDYRKLQELSSTYKKIKSPFNDAPLGSYIEVTPEESKVEPVKIDNPEQTSSVSNPDMLESSLIDFDKTYTQELLQKDIAAMCVHSQKGGLILTDYKVEETEDSSGNFFNYEYTALPIKGKKSTIKFKLPKISEEGTYTSNGIEYRLRRQKTDLPIRKISSIRVALTSSYGKVFIERSEKKAFNYSKWLCNNIRAASLDKENTRIVDSRTGDVFDPSIKDLPFLYTTLAKEFRTFTANHVFFYLDYHKRHKRLGEELVTQAESTGGIACGLTKDKDIVVMDKDNNLYAYSKGQYTPLDSIEDLCGLDPEKAPIPICEIGIMGRTIPVGIVLAYKLGFSQLLRMLGVEYKVITEYKGHHTEKDEYAITFKDVKYVFKKKDRLASLLLNGFNDFRQEIRDFNQHFFEGKDVYFNILDNKRVADRYLKEIDLLFSMFVDPITERILKEMHMPVSFRGLLFKAVELLMSDYHPDEVSAFEQRIRGYERMASLVYTELVRAIRAHNNKGIKHLSSITVNPQDILLKFLNDPANVPVNGLNPFQNIRQIESVTYTGLGGRSKDTMVKRTRKYHEGDIGVISESSVDSGDVGVNMYMSANPRLKSYYGLTDPSTEATRNGSVNAVEMMSTVFNTMPCIEKDDMKRIGFSSIHADANVCCTGYEVLPVRTGYDNMIPYRVGSLFATMAKQDGVVTSITPIEMVVTYKDKSRMAIPLGRQYGSDGGLTVPHLLVTDLKVGSHFKKGEALSYNTGYFTKDPLNPKALTMKIGTLATVAILENNYTLEDGSAITANFAKKLEMYQTKIRVIRVKFDQSIHNLVKPNQEVSSDDPLCIIEDSVTSQSSLFDKSSIELLRQLSAKAPKAKKNGRIEKIEAYYNGDIKDMSPSLQEIVKYTDRMMRETSKIKGGKGYIGRVYGNYLVEGNRIEENELVLKIYLTGKETAGNGD